MMKRIVWLSIFALVFIIAAVGCQSTNPVATSTSNTIPTTGANSVTPEALATTPPAATMAWPTLAPRVVSTSEPGLLSAYGMLVVMNPLSVIPAADDAIYLVPLPEGGENIASLPVLDENAIQAQVDETTGDFVFVNVKPGDYFVMVREMSGVVLPARLGNSDSLAFFKFTASEQNEAINLGLLSFP